MAQQKNYDNHVAQINEALKGVSAYDDKGVASPADVVAIPAGEEVFFGVNSARAFGLAMSAYLEQGANLDIAVQKEDRQNKGTETVVSFSIKQEVANNQAKFFEIVNYVNNFRFLTPSQLDDLKNPLQLNIPAYVQPNVQNAYVGNNELTSLNARFLAAGTQSYNIKNESQQAVLESVPFKNDSTAFYLPEGLAFGIGVSKMLQYPQAKNLGIEAHTRISGATSGRDAGVIGFSLSNNIINNQKAFTAVLDYINYQIRLDQSNNVAKEIGNAINGKLSTKEQFIGQPTEQDGLTFIKIDQIHAMYGYLTGYQAGKQLGISKCEGGFTIANENVEKCLAFIGSFVQQQTGMPPNVTVIPQRAIPQILPLPKLLNEPVYNPGSAPVVTVVPNPAFVNPGLTSVQQQFVNNGFDQVVTQQQFTQQPVIGTAFVVTQTQPQPVVGTFTSKVAREPGRPSSLAPKTPTNIPRRKEKTSEVDSLLDAQGIVGLFAAAVQTVAAGAKAEKTKYQNRISKNEILSGIKPDNNGFWLTLTNKKYVKNIQQNCDVDLTTENTKKGVSVYVRNDQLEGLFGCQSGYSGGGDTSKFNATELRNEINTWHQGNWTNKIQKDKIPNK